MTFLLMRNDNNAPHKLRTGQFNGLGSNDTGGNWTNGPALTLDVTGYWLVVYRGHAGNFADGGNSGYRILLNGAVGDSGNGGSGWGADVGLRWDGIANAGTVVQFQFYTNNNGFSGGVDGEVIATFIPTPVYRG